jgi:phage-related protein
MSRKLEVEIIGTDKGLSKALGKSESGLKRLGKAAAVGGVAIAGALVVGLEKSVKAAIEAQASEARLTQAFKNAHVAIGPLRHEIEGLESAGRKLGFTDEETTTSLGSLITATRNMKLATKDLSVAQDLSRFKHVSLGDATKMLTMAMTGSQRAAKQLGISVGPVTTTYDALKATMGTTIDASEKLRLAQAKLTDKQLTGIAVVDAVKAHVEGQAQAYSHTAAGAMEMFKAQLQHIEVEIGNFLLPTMMKAEQWIVAHWPQISAVIKKAWEQDIKPALTAFSGLVVAVVAAVRDNWSTIGPIVQRVANQVRLVFKLISEDMKFFSALLRGDWSAAWAAWKASAVAQLQLLWNAVRNIGLLIIAAMNALATGLKNALAAGLSGLGSLVTKALSAIIGAIKGLAGQVAAEAHAIGVAIVQGVASGIKDAAGGIASAAVSAVKGALGSAKGFIMGHSPSILFANEIGKPIADGIAQGIKDNEMAVINALRDVLTNAVRSGNFGTVSSIIQQMFSAKQGAARTPAEKKIAGIERAQNLEDLKQSIADAKTAVTNSAQALVDAQAAGDPAQIAAAQAQLAADQRAEKRAEQDLQLFHLQELAAKQRAALDAKQLEQQIKLSLVLDRLQVLFEKHHVTIAELLTAVRRILHRLGIPGFATGVKNFGGGLAMVGERGPELVNLPSGSDVIPNGSFGGATYVFNFPNYVGSKQELMSTIRNEARLIQQRTGRPAFS